MSEKFTSNWAGVSSGTNLTLQQIANNLASPGRRAGLFELDIGSSATPGDQAAQFIVARTTTQGTTPTATFTPINLDPGGPASSEYVSNQGSFSGEPTYTSNKQLLRFSCNQRALFRWVCYQPGYEILCAAVQNNGLGVRSVSSTSTQTYDGTTMWVE
jgi:hypothetical protein